MQAPAHVHMARQGEGGHRARSPWKPTVPMGQTPLSLSSQRGLTQKDSETVAKYLRAGCGWKRHVLAGATGGEMLLRYNMSLHIDSPEESILKTS